MIIIDNKNSYTNETRLLFTNYTKRSNHLDSNKYKKKKEQINRQTREPRSPPLSDNSKKGETSKAPIYSTS